MYGSIKQVRIGRYCRSSGTLRPLALACFALACSVLECGVVSAQSTTVIGNSNFGRECFTRAELAVTMNAATSHDVEVCSRALEEVTLTRDDRAATLVNKGILQSASGAMEDAKLSYDEALSLASDKGETHINIGNIYVRQQRYQDAVLEYTQGIAKDSRRPHVAYLNRGLAFEYLEDFQAASSDYTQALAMSPDWIRAKKMLARVNLKLSRQQARESRTTQ